jgi:hypothetical protein
VPLKIGIISGVSSKFHYKWAFLVAFLQSATKNTHLYWHFKEMPPKILIFSYTIENMPLK